MKKLYLLFVLVLPFGFLIAQTPFKDLDIKQFKYADAKIRTLDLSLYQFGQNIQTNFGIDNKNTKTKNFQFDGSATGYFFKNTRKQQFNSLLSVNLNGLKFSNYQEDRPWSIGSSLIWNAQSRYYHDNNSYVEISPDINLSYRKDDNLFLSTSVSLKKGIGRIEPVSDVYLMRWMLKEMEENGTDLSNLTQDDVFEISNKINVINNYRIFDNRRQVKAQIKDITLALNDKMSAPVDELDLYGIVFDNYTRAFVGNRYEGSRRAFVARPFVESNTTYYPQTLTRNGLGVELFGEYVKSRNTGLNTQHSVELQGGAGYNSSNFPNGREILYPFAKAKYQFDYFPNSRTTLSTYIDGAYRYVNYSLVNDVYVPPSISTLNANVGISANYFINYRTRIQADFSFSYDNQNVMNSLESNFNVFNFTNQIRFLHSIF